MVRWPKAVRAWRRRPLLPLAVVATLALGLGANTAVFTIARGVLLRPLDYPASDRLVRVWQTYATLRDSPNPRLQAMWDRLPASWRNAADWRDRSPSVAAVGLYEHGPVTWTGGDEPQRVEAARVDDGLFGTLAVPPIRGRAFTREEIDAGADVVVLGHAFWQQAFGGASGAVGRTIDLDGRPHEIVGIMPAGFRIPGQPDDRLWTQLRPTERDRTVRPNFAYHAVARLRADVAAAQAELDALSARIAADDPESGGVGVRLEPLHDVVTAGSGPLLALLGAAAALVLLVACVNVAHLLLVQGAARRRELAVRFAIGATRLQVARQLLAETVALGIAGGAAGLALAALSHRALAAGLPADLPRAGDVRVDGAVLAFALVASLAIAVAVGLFVAWRSVVAASVAGPDAALRGGAALAAPRGRLHDAFVVAEIALTLVLTAAAGLLANGFVRLASVDPGFATEDVVVQRLGLPPSRYADAEANRSFVERLVSRLEVLPGVAHAGVTTQLPLPGPGLVAGFDIPGRDDDGRPDRPEQPDDDEHWTQRRSASLRFVTPGYFATLGIPLVEGRLLEPADRPDGPKVVVVNRTLAERHWPGTSVVGRTITMGRDAEPHTIVGVVGDVRHDGLAAAPGELMYHPWWQSSTFGTPPVPTLVTVVRVTGAVDSHASAIRGAVRELDPALPLPPAASLAALVDASLGEPRSRTALVATLALLALLLSMVGTYAVIAFGVQGRVPEFGVRLALGARTGEIRRLVLRRVAWLAAAGIAIGLVATLAAGPLLRGMLHGVAPADPLTLTATAAALLAAAFAAGWLPARRASRTDPAVALRLD